MLKRIAKYIILTLFILFMRAAIADAQVKKADLRGEWYPARAEQLLMQLNNYLNKAEPQKIEGEIIGIIAPHAGLIYSGPVAAYSYNTIKGIKIDTVIVIGISHRKYYDGISIFDGEAYETPLGTVSIDKDMAKELIAQNKKIYSYPQAFKDENSIEMQIPFLQAALKDFKVVLIAIGDQSYENIEIIGNALHNVLKNKKNFLLVVSTDMHHFSPYEETNRIDRNTISIIDKLDSKELYAESLLAGHELMCGYGAVCAAMIAAKSLGADSISVLKYANSGDIVGNKSSVVGYLSAVIYKGNPKSQIQNHPPSSKKSIHGRYASADVRRRLSTLTKPIHEGGQEGEKEMLTEKQKKRLLQIARETMETYIKTGKRMEFKEDDSVLNREMGAFVTLHYKGELKGCIGNIVGRGPLYLTVRDMAIESSTGDPRFPAVTASELKDIDIEISVLSELKKIDDPNTIEIGKHGVLVRSGFRSGVFLPQVATETGWSREEFMNNLCAHKAGLPPDAWKKGKCEIYIFTAEVFGEK